MNNLVKEDEAELNKLLNELGDTMDANWNGNIEIPGGNGEANTEPEPPVEQDKTIGELINNGTIKIGDYVAYKPTGAESYTMDGTYNGTGSNQTVNKENLNWRVLDKTEDGKIRLISATPNNTRVSLQGADGYNNAVYLLDELCNTMYKGERATAKNLKIEDIQNKMNLSVWNYNNYQNYGSTFLPRRERNYPLIFEQEVGQTVNGTAGSVGVSEQKEKVTGTGMASTWVIKNNFWDSKMNASNYINSVYYDLFQMSATGGDYWLSSRGVEANNEYVLFHVRRAGYDGSRFNLIYHSCNNSHSLAYYIRPVVYLESNVQIDTEAIGKDGTSPDKAWVIK